MSECSRQRGQAFPCWIERAASAAVGRQRVGQLCRADWWRCWAWAGARGCRRSQRDHRQTARTASSAGGFAASSSAASCSTSAGVSNPEAAGAHRGKTLGNKWTQHAAGRQVYGMHDRAKAQGYDKDGCRKRCLVSWIREFRGGEGLSTTLDGRLG
jgi:hypothetical protein